VSSAPAFLLDTNVLSETRKKAPDPGPISFLKSIDSASLFLSVLTVGELRKGVAAKMRTDPVAAKRFLAWVEGIVVGFTGHILDVDAATARLWGEWSGDRPRPVVDTLLAATAVVHGLTLVTRNTRDFTGIPVKLHNPWTE
jgi:predicted nucleic acid-binding protein